MTRCLLHPGRYELIEIDRTFVAAGADERLGIKAAGFRTDRQRVPTILKARGT